MAARYILLFAVVTASALASCAFRAQEDTTELCSEYCDVAEENCGTLMGDYLAEGEFSRTLCLDACEDFPDELPSEADEREFEETRFASNDDTVQCRIYHANNAELDAEEHCPHASPSGAGVCVDFSPTCQAYCGAIVEDCQGEPGAIDTLGECEDHCRDLPNSAVTCRNDALSSQDLDEEARCATALGQTEACG